MKKFYLFICATFLVGNFALAQIPTPAPALPSPNVANLGLYGEIPVSHFTGTPDITIPLYEIKVGDYTLPISLSYHAASIRPDQHPGWAGLGWNLHAGGVISRTVHGSPDDWNIKNHPTYMTRGYYFHTQSLNKPQWSSVDYVRETAENYGTHDFEPDEFNFDFAGYHGKFMLNADKTWSVQCDKPIQVDFDGTWRDVPFDKFNTAFQYSGYSPCFDGFTLTTEDGTQYVFGKEENAIEYSIGFFEQATATWTATAWHLTKIIFSYGQEINFFYERGEFVNQMGIYLYDDLGSYTSSGGSLTPECSSSSHTSLGASYNGVLISPVYPSRISFPEGEITFERAQTGELGYPRDIYDFRYGIWQNSPRYRFLNFLADNPLTDNYPACLDKMKWYKLTNVAIKDKNEKWIQDYSLQYIDQPNRRLMLTAVSLFVWGLNGWSYEMEYNHPEMLPPYLAGSVDHWGFFNNRMMSDNYSTHYNSREPNGAVTVYGILSKLRYPTGGYTRFEFEPHTYTKQVKMNRWEGYDILPKAKIAGGVRIKRIINSSTGKEADEITDKEYFYTTDYLTNKEKSTLSSGILGGQFKYYFDDYQVQGMGADKNVKRVIKAFSSQSVLPACINSSGCHIGYTEVVEKRINGSFIRYQYTNFDNGYLDEAPDAVLNPNRTPYAPYLSRATERGQLLSEKAYSAEGLLKQSKEITYERSSNSYVPSMKTSLKNICPQTVITYADGCAYRVPLYTSRVKLCNNFNYDNPQLPGNTRTEYVYDPDGLIKEVITDVNGGKRKIAYKRPRECTEDIPAKMAKEHILSPIVEEIEYVIPTGKVAQQLKRAKYEYNLLEKKHFICSMIWEAVGNTMLRSVYECRHFDQWNHPMYVVTNKDKTVYLWGYNYMYLIAEIRGATIEEVERAMDGKLDDLCKSMNPDPEKFIQLRAALPHALITSYTHKLMTGVTSVTDPRGVTTYYEYDLLQRLKTEKNMNKEVEKTYDYQYAGDFI